jgi:flagellar assembly factor FliW
MTAIGNLALTTEHDAAADVTADGDEIAIAQALRFDDGLFGFPACRSFGLVPTVHPGLFWLQSTEHEPLRLLLADPFVFFDGYSVDLPDADVKRLAPEMADDVAILATVTIGEGPQGITANLQGPIAIDVRTGRARQFIVSDPARQVREPIDLARGLD